MAKPAGGKITVQWQMSDPPVVARSWQQWDETPTPSADDLRTESSLGWEPGTIAAVRLGFALKLGRAVGWESESAAVLMAAQMFKRGVARRQLGGTASLHDSSGRYEIVIEQDDRFLDCADDVFTVIDGNVARAWPHLKLGLRSLTLTLDEHSKTLESVAKIITAAKTGGKVRSWRVIGGGLLTDVVAFAAALQQAPITFVPTTLLAMADACIGGKTGVNFAPFGKNQVGRFYFPTRVSIWTGWLHTLSARELIGGGAECIKHAFLRGDEALAQNLAQALSRRDLDSLATLLPDVIALKAEVVREDPTENGRRAILNFGHTLAHALEAYAHARVSGVETLTHGEAVGVGMVFALLASSKYAGLSATKCQELINVLKAAGCATSVVQLSRRIGASDLAAQSLRADLKALIANDKKSTDAGSSEWVLFAAPGVVARSPLSAWTINLPLTVVDELWPDFLRALG